MKVHHFVVFLFFIVSASLLYGQGGANGTILGTVTDNSGAVVGNAKVDFTNIATGITNHAETSSDGNFTVPYLTPGAYRVTVAATGFQKAVADNIVLAVAQQARVNVTMKPGAVSETVEVQASAVSLDTDSATVSQLISQKQVEQLPLNGRNFLNLLFIGAGAYRPMVNKARCGRVKETPSASMAAGRPQTITPWTDWSTLTLL
jgi:hypothetical protein